MKKTKLEELKQATRKALALLECDEVVGIYSFAAAHNVRLSETYIKKAHPIFNKLRRLVKV